MVLRINEKPTALARALSPDVSKSWDQRHNWPEGLSPCGLNQWPTPANDGVPVEVSPLREEGLHQQCEEVQAFDEQPEVVGHHAVVEENHHSFAFHLHRQQRKGELSALPPGKFWNPVPQNKGKSRAYPHWPAQPQVPQGPKIIGVPGWRRQNTQHPRTQDNLLSQEQSTKTGDNRLKLQAPLSYPLSLAQHCNQVSRKRNNQQSPQDTATK